MAILDPAASCRLQFGGEMFGYVGRLLHEALRQFDLRGPAAVAEIRLAPLVEECRPGAALRAAVALIRR